MVQVLKSIGWRSQGDETPLTWSEIANYSRNVCELNDWEAETLHRMSVGYCVGKQTGSNVMGIFPGDPVEGDED